MTAFADLLEEGRVRSDVPLGPLTTYRRAGSARWYLPIERSAELRIIVPTDVPVLVLGRGSNLVVATGGFDGLVLHVLPGGDRPSVDGTTVVAGGGVPLPQLAREAAAADVGGLSFFVGIPGSVGGAVRMNAGCHGSETVDVLVEAEVWNLRTGKGERRGPGALDLAYRHSNLTDDELVIGATFEGVESSRSTEESVMREITQWRKEHQPGGTFNAGSVFKNPPGDAAGRIIDALGLKGTSVGGARVSERHANFIEADATATPEDIHALTLLIQGLVQERSGITLGTEIRFVGFDA